MSGAKMKVSMRLGIGFGAVGLLLGAVVVVGSLRLEAVDAQVELVVKDKYPKLEQVQAVKDGVNVIARASRAIFLVSRDQIGKELARIAPTDEEITATLSSLDAEVKSEAGRRAFNEVADAKRVYSERVAQFIKLVEAGRMDEGKQYLMGELRPAHDKLYAATVKFAEHQSDSLKESAEVAAEIAATGKLVMLVLGCVALAIAALAGVFITRNLLRQLGGEPEVAAGLANRIAAGDLSSTVASA
jgi:methyl-accepting chemotaxis protein